MTEQNDPTSISFPFFPFELRKPKIMFSFLFRFFFFGDTYFVWNIYCFNSCVKVIYWAILYKLRHTYINLLGPQMGTFHWHNWLICNICNIKCVNKCQVYMNKHFFILLFCSEFLVLLFRLIYICTSFRPRLRPLSIQFALKSFGVIYSVFSRVLL